ncbi:Chloramphenicol acetyltransferase [Desulfovibrio sp. TomC]|nr:Chloramphenicol acetyltransferase [Desulfovibrio sp. TomC]
MGKAMRVIDLDQWERREHFQFFQGRRNPCLAVTAPVSVENLTTYRKRCAGTKPRLSDCLYYAIMQSANSVPELRLRLVDLRPVEFDTVNAGFTYVPQGKSLHANCVAGYATDFARFAAALDAARAAADLRPTLTPAGAEGQGLIYMSNLPEVAFTALSNPWGDPWQDSVPRVVFGKIDPGLLTLPVALEVLHSFVDGRHVSLFCERLEAVLSEPEGVFSGV